MNENMGKKEKESYLCNQLQKNKQINISIFNIFINIRLQLTPIMSQIKLTLEQKIKFGKIIYNQQGREKQLINELTEQELQLLRNLYAQKIAYEAVNGKIQQFVYGQPIYPLKEPEIPSLWESLFCLCYPVNHQQYFDVTTEIFLERCFYPFFFWNSGFFNLHDEMVEYYGYLWMLLTYSILLGLSSNLSDFFVKPTNYDIDNWIFVQSIGLVFIDKTIQVIVFSSAIGCLGGRILFFQVMMIEGYSLVLYFIPTLLCLAPSLYWHVLMLAVAGIFRALFLSRNFSSKIQSRHYLVYLGVFVSQIVYFFLVIRIMFGDDSGYTFEQGFLSVVPPKPTTEQNQTTISHLLTYIPFQFNHHISRIPNQTGHFNQNVHYSSLRVYDI